VNDPDNIGVDRLHKILHAITQVGPGTPKERLSVAAPPFYVLQKFVHQEYTFEEITGEHCYCRCW
jgi:hypothetical protein